MFTYDETDTQKCITACDLTNVHFVGEPNVTSANGGLKCEDLFPIGSIWISINGAVSNYQSCVRKIDG